MVCVVVVFISMHYTRLDVVDDPKYKVESIAVLPLRRGASVNAPSPAALLDPGLVVGGSDGTLSIFRLDAPPRKEVPIVPKRITRRSVWSSKAPVVQVLYEPRLREARVFALCGGRPSLFRLMGETLEPLADVTTGDGSKLDGVTSMCVSLPSPATITAAFHGTPPPPDGEPARFAAVIRRQAYLFELTESGLTPYTVVSATEGSREGGVIHSLPEGANQIEWCGYSLIVATRRGYSVFDVRTQQLKDELVIGRSQSDPLMRPLPNGTVGIKANQKILFWNLFERSQTFDTLASFPLSESAQAEEIATFGYCPPFLLFAKQNGKFEVSSTVDQMAFPYPPPNVTSRDTIPRVAAECPGYIILASPKDVIVFFLAPVMDTVDAYVRSSLFQRAVEHYKAMSDLERTDVLANFEGGLKSVYARCAAQAIVRGMIPVALEYFDLARSDSLTIIQHFPLLQSAEVSAYFGNTAAAQPAAAPPPSSANSTAMRPTQTAYQLKLYEILRQQRQRDVDDLSQRATDYALLVLLLSPEGIPDDAIKGLFDREAALEELLMPSNHLNYVEALNMISGILAAGSPQRLLLLHCQALLHASHGHAEIALDVARNNGLVADAVIVLQQNQQANLVAQHLPWMIATDATIAVDAVCVRESALPPEVVTGLLQGCPHHVMARYLAFAIHENGVIDPDIHTQYALTLIAQLAPLRGLTSVRKRLNVAPLPGEEPGAFGELRRNFLLFLASSKLYDGDTVLAAMRAARESRRNAPFAVFSSDDDDESGVTMSAEIRALRIYRRYNPEKVAQIADVLRTYERRYSEMIEDLVQKYGPEPTPAEDDDFIQQRITLERQRRRAKTRSTWLLHEEALVYARHGDHTAVLTTLVYRLHDIRLAEQYCFTTFVTDDIRRSISPQASSVTRSASSPTMSKLHRSRSAVGLKNRTKPMGPTTATSGSFHPTESGAMRAVAASARTSASLTDLVLVLLAPPRGYTAMQEEAVRVLHTYSSYISPLAVMEALPADTQFSLIAPYIAHVAVRAANTQTLTEITRQSTLAHQQELTCARDALQMRYVYVDRDRPCVVCGKPLMGTGGIFAVFPNLCTAHFRCFKDKDCDPQRGVPFRPVYESLL